MNKDYKYCIWLTFNSIELEKTIFQLSKKFKNPIFQSHCTLLGHTNIPVIRLKSAILKLIDNFELVELHIKKIAYTNDYWRSYYLELNEEHKLIELHEQLAEFLSIKKNDDYFPHISLMYSLISEERKKKIMLPDFTKKNIKIRSIQITECGDNIENWKPVFELMLNN